MYRNEVFISSKYILDDYLDLKLSLNSLQEDWERAVGIFQDRIEGRYLLLIQQFSDRIQVDYRYIDYSFSSMALCCLLIETLHQFYKGLNETEFRGHRDAFVTFLTSSDYFGHHFTRKTAGVFYSDIRNGILHQAQTKRNTQLTLDQEQMVFEIENGIRLDVIKFKDELINEYEQYIGKLIKGTNIALRENFITKMNYLTKTK